MIPARPETGCWAIASSTRLGALHLPSWDVEETLVVVARHSLSVRLSRNVLSPNERARYARFRRSDDCARFLVAHGLKRLLLSQLTGTAADRLVFCTTKYGKPHLSDGSVHFNLSHSGAWVALAFSRETAVGVDIEDPKCSDSVPSESVLFHPGDILAPTKEPRDRFFTAWTLKEAVTKCTGSGLAYPLPLIRLRHHSAGLHEATAHTRELRIWCRHGRLDGGAHLALATPCRNTRPCVIRVL